MSFGRRIVEKIVLFPQISKAVIFCGKSNNQIFIIMFDWRYYFFFIYLINGYLKCLDSTLSFYSLPQMEPIDNFPLIKGVTCFSYDLSMEGKVERDGSVKICAIKKRMIYIFSIDEHHCVEEEV